MLGSSTPYLLSGHTTNYDPNSMLFYRNSGREKRVQLFRHSTGI